MININAREFEDKIRQSESIILDVRTPSEYKEEHIPNSKNIDVKDNVFLEKIKTLNPTDTYFVYCRSGVRSANACSIMTSLGFEKLYNLSGGIMTWKGEIVKN